MELLQTYRLKIRSTFSELVRVEKFIEEIIADFQISDQLYGNMVICLTEAVNNAIIHGNKMDATKHISIVFQPEEDSWIITVKDEGSGFDYDSLPDPTLPENLTKPSGRGIFIIKNLCDKVEYEQNGSLVKLYFAKK